MIPWRAAVVALVLAVVLGSALLARAQGTATEGEPVVAARTTPRAVPSGSGLPPSSRVGSAGGQSAVGTPPGGPAVLGVSSPPGGASPAAGLVVVHVTGMVRRPGLVRLASGSRVWDAVTAAGGAGTGARLDRLNLARPLSDGEQVMVPGPNDPVTVPVPPAPVAGAAAAGSAGAGAAAPGRLIDLNAATEADLDGLPGVGPVLAGRILAWRTQHGRFTRVEELGEVPGIGVKLLAQLSPLVRV